MPSQQNEPRLIEDGAGRLTTVFNDEQEFEEIERYGITGNVSSPAITSRPSQNSSSPSNTGRATDNTSSPSITGRHSDNSSSPEVTNQGNEGEIIDEAEVIEYEENHLEGETEGYDIDYGEENEEADIVEEELIGELVMGLTDDGEWVVQSVRTTDIDRDEAQDFAEAIAEQLEEDN